MVDEFLLNKIRERMKEKGMTLDELRQSLGKLYRDTDMNLAFQAYREEEERRVTEQAIQVNEEISRKKEKSFSGGLASFLFHQPYLWIALLVVIFIRIYEWRSSLISFSSSWMETFFLIFFSILFIAIVLFLARTIGWVAEFHETFGKPGKTMLRGMQVEIMNCAVLMGMEKIAGSHPSIVLIVFLITGIIFEIVLISLAFRLDFKGAISTFLFFQLLFWVLVFSAYVILNLVFLPSPL
jgi:hypothetical protein